MKEESHEPEERKESIIAVYCIAILIPAIASPIMFYVRLMEGVNNEGFAPLATFFIALLWGGLHGIFIFLINLLVVRILGIQRKDAAMGICAITIMLTVGFVPQIMEGYGKLIE